MPLRVSAGWSLFLSTPSARRATKPPAGKPAVIRISIHALREEGDGRYQVKRKMPDGISIHALREEGDLWKWSRKPEKFRFLSTPSARRATAAVFMSL